MVDNGGISADILAKVLGHILQNYTKVLTYYMYNVNLATESSYRLIAVRQQIMQHGVKYQCIYYFIISHIYYNLID